MAAPDILARQLNFAWLELDQVAGCRGPRTPADIINLRSLGICALVRLAAESPLSAKEVEASGLLDHHVPILDFMPPTLEQIESVVTFIEEQVALSRPVAVSCGAGYGRTGTLLACLLVQRGNSALDSLERVRSINKYPETDAQRDVVHRWEVLRTKS